MLSIATTSVGETNSAIEKDRTAALMQGLLKKKEGGNALPCLFTLCPVFYLDPKVKVSKLNDLNKKFKVELIEAIFEMIIRRTGKILDCKISIPNCVQGTLYGVFEAEIQEKKLNFEIELPQIFQEEINSSFGEKFISNEPEKCIWNAIHRSLLRYPGGNVNFCLVFFYQSTFWIIHRGDTRGALYWSKTLHSSSMIAQVSIDGRDSITRYYLDANLENNKYVYSSNGNKYLLLATNHFWRSTTVLELQKSFDTILNNQEDISFQLAALASYYRCCLNFNVLLFSL